MSSPSPDFLRRVRHWRECATAVDSPFLAQADEVISQLESQGEGEAFSPDLKTQLKHYTKDISFGTAGLRAEMGAGWARMNDVTVRAASQGMAAYLREVIAEKNEDEVRVVVGFDSRHNSRFFAEIAAATFLAASERDFGVAGEAKPKFKVFMYREFAATPSVSFGVKAAKAHAGVMVTASHNPKEDNGYKVYWHRTAQITSPVDKHIAAQIARDDNRNPWTAPQVAGREREILDTAKASGDLVYVDEEFTDAYMKEIAQKMCFHRDDNQSSTTKIVFTPMHGVGQAFVERSFSQFGLPPFVSVPEQKDPNPDFPTVAFPNPEEGEGALLLSMQAADAAGSTVIVANDPDADRLALAEKQRDGKWRVFTGNETAMLVADWLWEHRKAQIARETSDAAERQARAARTLVLSSTVSSHWLKRFAEVEGLYHEETLTGFKWLGNTSLDLLESMEGSEILFAFEESIGFMLGDTCFDKDGVRAAPVLSEMAVQLYEHRNRNFAEHLEDIEKRYGVFAVKSKYFFCYDRDVSDKVFNKLREDGNYPKEVTAQDAQGHSKSWAITRVRDMTKTSANPEGYDSATPGNKPQFEGQSGQMITFWFDNGAWLTVRDSGTEPKLKYYSELSGVTHPDNLSRPQLEAELDTLVDAALELFLQPEANGFIRPQ